MKFNIFIVSTILFLSSVTLFGQTQIRYNYGSFGAKITNGSSSIQSAPAGYSTQTISAGNYKNQGGFLSILANGNIIDSLALVDLYNATNPGDTTWNIADGWLTAPLDQWHGVQLDPSGRVFTLDLNQNNLTGTIPQSLKNLDSLRNLYFYVNPGLEGNLFDFLATYSKLERVSAHDCLFTGPILPEVFRPSLLEIRVFNNQISGTIPIEIANAPLMDQFMVANNLLTGTIPTSIGQLTNVVSLDLSQNNITGTIPLEIAAMDSLQFLYLENTLMEGEIPAEILNCPSLIELWISGNNFSGTLPDVLNMPNFRALQAGGNANLLVPIPPNLGELTQLEFLSIWNTRPNGGPFPEGVYNLVNLYGLDLSEQLFTGTIDERIGNLSNLSSLYLRNNLLTGAFPIEILSAGNLNTLDLSTNDFDFIPDLSQMAALENVSLQRNRLQFESLLPYLGKSNFTYAPQKVIGVPENREVAIGSTVEITSSIQSFGNANYQWIANGDSLASATAVSLSVTNFTTFKSGRYFLQSTHPDLPELLLNSAAINLKIAGGKTNWYVDNRAGTIADFRNLSQAVSATKAGDTIYIAGSPQLYESVSVNEARTFIGPGYFLAENPETQFNTQAASINILQLAIGASGSRVYGISANLLRLNNQSSSAPDTLENITIVGNRIDRLNFADKNNQIVASGNFIGNLQFSSTSVQNVIRSYSNFTVTNNIIDTVNTFFDIISTEKNSLQNMNFEYNTIRSISDSVNGINFTNSIIGAQGNGTNSFSNNIAFDPALFTNTSGSLNIDNDYVPVNASLAQGPFAGHNPYILSGLPPVPSIYNVQIGARLSAKLNIASNSERNISNVRYLYRRNNQSSTPFNVSGFAASPSVEVEFLPNRSVIQPNQIYDLIFQAVDANGVRSHRTYIPYEAIAANLSGTVVDIDNNNILNGNVRLFAINPFANKYDTASVQTLNGSNTFNFENLILGDYIILADPDTVQYPDLIPTYLGNTIDWPLADTLLLQGPVTGVTIEVEKEPAPLVEPGSEINGFVEEEFDEADSSLRVLPRRRVAGAGVSVRRLSGSSRPTSGLRIMQNNYELIAYLQTDENGSFTFPNLPSGDYKIRIEYPGVEVDEATDVDFNLSGERGEEVSVEAVVEDGFVRVTETGRVLSATDENPLVYSYFPNPVKNVLHLVLTQGDGETKLTIFDLQGRVQKTVRLEQGDNALDLSQLNTGTYILRLVDQNGNYMMSKIIKD